MKILPRIQINLRMPVMKNMLLRSMKLAAGMKVSKEEV